MILTNESPIKVFKSLLYDMPWQLQKKPVRFPVADKIAIPDFGTGAMENWGLITYRESNLLYDEKESSSYNKQRVASVIAHELVHQVNDSCFI